MEAIEQRIEKAETLWRSGYTELLGDWFLHFLAPVGVFELVAYFAKSDGAASALCKRNA